MSFSDLPQAWIPSKKVGTDESVPNKTVWELYLIKEGSSVKDGLIRSAFYATAEELGQHEYVVVEGRLDEKGVDAEDIIA